MNAEILIKARKVFVKEPIEYSETCPHCASKGIDNKLRYYYISLEEAIYKCAGSTCLYPFQRYIFKSLVDNTVYYYEEVLEGGRMAIFRVPLDDQPIYQSKNPLSTQLFCDSQRNPDIESYKDLQELFDELESESEPETQWQSVLNNQVLNENLINELTTPIKTVRKARNSKTKDALVKAESLPEPDLTASEIVAKCETVTSSSIIENITAHRDENITTSNQFSLSSAFDVISIQKNKAVNIPDSKRITILEDISIKLPVSKYANTMPCENTAETATEIQQKDQQPVILRGRPKKYQPISEQQSEEKTEKKQRGRPRKNPSAPIERNKSKKSTTKKNQWPACNLFKKQN